MFGFCQVELSLFLLCQLQNQIPCGIHRKPLFFFLPEHFPECMDQHVVHDPVHLYISHSCHRRASFFLFFLNHNIPHFLPESYCKRAGKSPFYQRSGDFLLLAGFSVFSSGMANSSVINSCSLLPRLRSTCLPME